MLPRKRYGKTFEVRKAPEGHNELSGTIFVHGITVSSVPIVRCRSDGARRDEGPGGAKACLHRGRSENLAEPPHG